MNSINRSLMGLILLFSVWNLSAQQFSEHEKQEGKKRILELYYKPLPDNAINLSYDSLMKLTDPYTFLINRSVREQWFNPSKFTHARIGLSYQSDSANHLITNIEFEGSAYTAGLAKGNCILTVNGRYPTSKEELSLMMNGDSGTTILLTVQEKYTGQVIDVSVKKDYLEEQSIYVERIGKSAIIRLEDFHEDAHQQFVNVSEALIPESIDTLLVDVRDNPGGLVLEAVQILSEFLPPDLPIIKNQYKKKSDTLKTYRSHFGLWSHLKKIYVLTNGGSASASEMLAGVLLKMTNKTEIIGDTTYGKGLMQSAFPLQPKGAYLHVTVAEYFPGLNLKVDKIGIVPHRKFQRLKKVPIPSNAEILRIRQEYPLPSTKAFQDERLKNKEFLAEYIWGIQGQLYAILAKGLFKKKEKPITNQETES